MLEKYELRKCKRRELRVSTLSQGFLLDIGKEQAERYNGNKALLPWLVTVMETGMRPGEAAKVELDWFKTKKLQLEIPEDGQKKRAARIVMLTEDTVELLKQQADRAIAAESKYLFFSINPISKKPVPFSYTTPYARLSKKVSIKGGAHALRHEFISRLFEESNMSDSQIALLAGDKSTMSLEPYKHLSVNKLREQHYEVATNVKKEQNKEVAHYLKTEFTKRVEAGIAKLLADRDKRG
jgi:integrase